LGLNFDFFLPSPSGPAKIKNVQKMDPILKRWTIFQSQNRKVGCSIAPVIYSCFAVIVSFFPHILDSWTS